MAKGVLLFLIGISVSATGSISHALIQHNEPNVISVLSESSKNELPKSLNILTWNIHKAEALQAWAYDFVELTTPAQLMLVQESMQNYVVEDAIKQLTDFNFTMATSFLVDDYTATGVMTGAKANPLESHYLRSPDTEPIANTPKMALVQKFAVAGSSESLLVINVHAINFVFKPAFTRQVRQIVKRIQNHVGPVLLAGDFNTWSGGRWEVLSQATASVGLKHVPVAIDHRFLQLDHIFVRGLNVKSVAILDTVHTSDHFPMRAEVEIDSNVLELNPLAVHHSMPEVVGM